LIALILAAVPSSLVRAHTIPASSLTLVPDEAYVHAELVFNPFDLTFFAEADKDRSGLLERGELPRFEELGKRLILDAIELRVNGKVVQAEVAGVILAADNHHVIFRAQYPADARDVPLSIACRLSKITRGGHLTTVKYIHRGRTQTAVLDTDRALATFRPATASPKGGAQAP
jgi:hypothetical protein